MLARLLSVVLLSSLGTAHADVLRAAGSVQDSKTKKSIPAVELVVLDSKQRRLGSGVSNSSGQLDFQLTPYDGTHVFCSFTSTDYGPITIAARVSDGKVDCSVLLKRSLGLTLSELAVIDDAKKNVIEVHAYLTNATSAAIVVDRFDLSGVWKAMRSCADPGQTFRYDLKVGVRSGMVNIHDDLEITDTHPDSALHVAANACEYTCLHVGFHPAVTIPANDKRLVSMTIDRKVIDANTTLPTGTDAAFRLDASYANGHVASSEALPANPALLPKLWSDVDCRPAP